MFWRHFITLSKKNLILYKRNWKGSLCEIICPILLISLVLIIRILVNKKQKDPKHMFDKGYIWNDVNDGIASKDFMSFQAHDPTVEWLSYCKDRDYGPDRTIIALAPAGNTIVDSVKSTVEAIVSLEGYTVNTYSSRDEIISIIAKSTYEKDGSPGICMGVALEISDSTNNQYQLNMIFDDITIEASSDSNMPNQRFGATDKYLREPFLDAWDQYQQGGYTYLQNLFANHILKERTNTNSYISMAYVPVKSSKYNKDDFAYIVSEMWSFFVLFVFLGNLYRLVYNTVNEKETKVREAMKIMGLTDTAYWLSWFAYSLVINTFLCILMILICIPIFEYSDMFIIFCYFWFYGLTMFGFAVFIGAFFSSGKTAAIVASMLFFLTSFLQIAVERRTVSETNKVLASFFPAVNVQLAGTILFEFEASGNGLTYDNMDELYKNYRFSYTIYMNIINFIVFTLLGLYLEKVLPGATGVRRPFWFPFTRHFWCGSSSKNPKQHEGEGNRVGHSSDEDNFESKDNIDRENFEEIPEQLRRKEENHEFLQIRNLRKKFDKGFIAVNDLNAEMYEDQIFALLGHNGAGKTTTINMLCGMIGKTKGEATIYGYDTSTQMNEIRKIMGYCPQHNILFPNLTVKEHLQIFAKFKGADSAEINEEIDNLVKDLNLESRKNFMSKDLSGGYKRKLSLGIALVGGSKIVFLDEPSSGMDVTARREMWDMLKKYKNNRIIILTTHYMEEADNLGDRIGIMSHGQMLCCGTPDFLKNKFGEGYNLVVVKSEREENKALESFVTNNIPGSSKVSEVSSEATYLLPKASSKYFSEFFKRFDNDLNKLGVTSYGVSMTTLEEVFLKVEQDPEKAEIVDEIRQKRISALEDDADEEYSISKEQIEGSFVVFGIHFWALLLKRLLLSKRSLKTFVMELLIPGFLIIGGFGLTKIKFLKDSPQVVLDTSLFPDDQRLIYNSNAVVSTGGTDNPSDLINLLRNPSDFNITSDSGSYADSQAGLEIYDDVLYNAAQTNPISPFRYGHYFFHTTDYSNHQYKVVTFANSTSQEAKPAFAQFMYEAILRKSIGSNTLNFTAVNDPMPIVQIWEDDEKSNNTYFIGFVLGIALALVPTSIVGFLLNERNNQLLHQQIISGMNKASYWMSNYVFDLARLFVTVIFAIAFLYIFDVGIKYAWLFLLLFPFAMVPYTYVTSFLFSDENGAMNFTTYHNFIVGGLFPTIFSVLRVAKTTKKLGDILVWAPRFIPIFNCINGIIMIKSKDVIYTARNEKIPKNFSTKASGGDLYLLIAQIFIWTLLIFLIEIGAFNFLRSKGRTVTDQPEELDNDVAKEQDRVEGIPEKDLAVKANHLRKVYNGKVAVKDVSFGLDFGDCFCLLGVNGAGKTTTFKMLTNFVVPTQGECHVKGFNSKTQFPEARKQIGYCPQFDAIFPLMTVREHLQFYVNIKKIPKEYAENLIVKQLQDMNLEQYEHRQAGALSGGNKRKLSVAMAMIGNPPVVFLDEPSAGMDPKARRFMWEIISKISTRGKNSAVILTTHSMEEAEALSTSMGIMVDGQFKCFGSKQHIKNKFGTGYQVEIKFRALKEEAIDSKIKSLNIMEFLRQNYPASYRIEHIKGHEMEMLNREACIAVLKEVFQNERAFNEFRDQGFGKEPLSILEANGYYPLRSLISWEFIQANNLEALETLVNEFGEAILLEQFTPRFRYAVPKGEKSVGYFFSLLETLKEKLDIDEYSASQTTLEQIFNRFARVKDVDLSQRKFNQEILQRGPAPPQTSEGIQAESYSVEPEEMNQNKVQRIQEDDLENRNRSESGVSLNKDEEE